MLITSNFGYYARTMITLAVIAYSDDMSAIPSQVQQQAQQQVVWGPVELKDELGVSYSRAFIAKDAAHNEYTVVIRGTNFLSWRSWTRQDFAIDRLVRFNTLPLLADLPAGQVPDNAQVSQGAFNGMADLLKLRDSSGQTLVEYLQQATPGTLYVTGHSLGGTLTPPMYAYLNEVLPGWAGQQMGLYSFAGLTPGDTAFNRYLNAKIDPSLQWRFHNTLDIAPLLWSSYTQLENIYAAHNLRWGWLECDWLTSMFHRSRDRGYAQPQEGFALPGTFRHGFLDLQGTHWIDQALHQHHGATYQKLVFAAFPGDTVRTALHFRGIRQREAAAVGR